MHWKLCCHASVPGGDCPFSCWQVDFRGQLPLSVGNTCLPAITCMDTVMGLLLATSTRNTSSKQVTLFLFWVYLAPIWPSWHHWLKSRVPFYCPHKTALGSPTGYPMGLPFSLWSSGIIEQNNGLLKSLLFKLQGSKWTPKWLFLLPGAFTTLNSQPYGHRSSHTNWAHLAMLPMIVIEGNLMP